VYIEEELITLVLGSVEVAEAEEDPTRRTEAVGFFGRSPDGSPRVRAADPKRVRELADEHGRDPRHWAPGNRDLRGIINLFRGVLGGFHGHLGSAGASRYPSLDDLIEIGQHYAASETLEDLVAQLGPSEEIDGLTSRELVVGPARPRRLPRTMHLLIASPHTAYTREQIEDRHGDYSAYATNIYNSALETTGSERHAMIITANQLGIAVYRSDFGAHQGFYRFRRIDE
jgi:hypothetical protein